MPLNPNGKKKENNSVCLIVCCVAPWVDVVNFQAHTKQSTKLISIAEQSIFFFRWATQERVRFAMWRHGWFHNWALTIEILLRFDSQLLAGILGARPLHYYCWICIHYGHNLFFKFPLARVSRLWLKLNYNFKTDLLQLLGLYTVESSYTYWYYLTFSLTFLKINCSLLYHLHYMGNW